MELAGKVPALPRSRLDANLPMCFAFHAIGLCNVRCARARDHVPYETGSSQYVALGRWAQTCYLVKADLDAALPIAAVG